MKIFCSDPFTISYQQPYSKVFFGGFFWNFCLRKFLLLFFAEFKLLMFHNNIVKISEKLNKRNLVKICLKVTYPTDSCISCLHFYCGRKLKCLMFQKSMTRIKAFLHSMANGFALNHDKSLQIYLFCVKHQAKNNFLKDVESTVSISTHYLLNILILKFEICRSTTS